MRVTTYPLATPDNFKRNIRLKLRGERPLSGVSPIAGMPQWAVACSRAALLSAMLTPLLSALQVQLDLRRAVQGREHGKVDQAARPAVERVVALDPTQGPGGRGALESHHEVVGPGHRRVDVVGAENLAANG